MVFSADGRGRASSPILAFAWLSDAGSRGAKRPKSRLDVRKLLHEVEVPPVKSTVNLRINPRQLGFCLGGAQLIRALRGDLFAQILEFFQLSAAGNDGPCLHLACVLRGEVWGFHESKMQQELCRVKCRVMVA